MSIDTKKKTLVEIISAASNTSFKVPNFQRDFAGKILDKTKGGFELMNESLKIECEK